jgi:hypothetical protein
MNMESSKGKFAALSPRPIHLLVEFAYKIPCAMNLQLSSEPDCLKSPLYDQNKHRINPYKTNPVT